MENQPFLYPFSLPCSITPHIAQLDLTIEFSFPTDVELCEIVLKNSFTSLLFFKRMWIYHQNFRCSNVLCEFPQCWWKLFFISHGIYLDKYLVRHEDLHAWKSHSTSCFSGDEKVISKKLWLNPPIYHHPIVGAKIPHQRNIISILIQLSCNLKCTFCHFGVNWPNFR